MVTSTLYQNGNRTIILLDLPKSLEIGQTFKTNAEEPVRGSARRIVSTVPLQAPYPSTEPKGDKRVRVLGRSSIVEQKYHNRIQDLVLHGLEEIRSTVQGNPWCLPRQHPILNTAQASFTPDSSPTVTESPLKPPVILSSIPNIFHDVDEIRQHCFFNPHSQAVPLVVGSRNFQVPPGSGFLLGDVQGSDDAFRSSRLIFRRRFDFVLLDPPWENRSVRHAKPYIVPKIDLHPGKEDSNVCPKESSSVRGLRCHPFVSALGVIDDFLEDRGYVGIWVTNKASVREFVLKTLESEDFRLCEEWIWAKTTVGGEPITPLRGVWRHPYEVLLLFRRREISNFTASNVPSRADPFAWDESVIRRVFFAVPDAHSRKPCLKEYIGSLLLNSNDYSALEIFARIITAGWFGWGDEVLKFNEEMHWRGAVD